MDHRSATHIPLSTTGASPVKEELAQLYNGWNSTYLLLLPQSEKADTGDLDDLEADTGNITLGLTAATETGDEDLVVLVDEVQATIVLTWRNS